MKCKEILEKENVNLQLKNKRKQNLKEKGITLIALVVTIIILLILAGVTLNIALSGDGLFSKAKLAVNKYDVASEQEILQQQIIEYRMDNSIEKIGEKLSDKVSSVTDSNWKVIQLNNSDENYGTNYYYIEKGTEIANYGKTKYNWVMNYETGEVINIEGYTVLDGNAGMSVKTNIALNINPLNLGDQSKWGNNTKFVGNEDKSENSGVHGAELKFDGIDDYLRIDNVNIEENNQLTFEFYGQYSNGCALPLESIGIDEKNIPCRAGGFRSVIYSKGGFQLCLGLIDSESDLKDNPNTHWLLYRKLGEIKGDSDFYISITVNYSSGNVELFFADERWECKKGKHDM